MMRDFFYRYFVNPITFGYGYNMVNTIVYAVLFIVFVLITERILRRIKVRINREFLLAVIPFVVAGTFLRVIEDSGLIETPFLKTPFIWIIFFSFIISLLSISSFIQKKRGIPYYKIMFVFGIFSIGMFSGFLKYVNMISILYVSIWFIPFIVLIYLVKWSTENKLVTSMQAFDAVVTFVSMKYFGYLEQHVIPNIIIKGTGTPFSFILVKLIVVVLALQVIDRYSEDEDTKNLMKFSIALLGLGPGLRDLIRLVALV